MGNSCNTEQKAPVSDQEPLAPSLSPSTKPPRRTREKGSEDLAEEELDALVKPRKCTDVLCIFLFLAGMVALGVVLQYAAQHGDIRRLYHGIDWQNKVCGVDEGVADAPFLYWCSSGNGDMSSASLSLAGIAQQVMDPAGQNVQLAGLNAVLFASTSLDTRHPICIKECPDMDSTFKSCLQMVEEEEQSPRDPTGTYWKKYSYHMSFIQDYPSTSVMQRYCVPKDEAMLAQLNSTMTEGMNAAMLRSSTVLSSWLAISTAALLAVVLSYVYIFLMDKLAVLLIYALLIISTLASILTGLVFLYAAFFDDISAEMETHFGGNATLPYMPSVVNKEADMGIGLVLCVLGILIGTLGCCWRKSLDLVIATVQTTVSVMWDLPSLLLMPLVSAVGRFVVASLAGLGLCWLLSVGSVSHYDLGEYVPTGIARNFLNKDDDLTYVVAYLFLTLWIYEFGVALEQFVVAYTVQLWYFAEYKDGRKSVPWFSIPRSYLSGLTYHFGSLACGSAIMACLRCIYFVIEYVRRETVRQSGGDERLNAVSQGAAAGCGCCLSCIESLVKYLNKGAYLVVAVESVGFCTAADISAELIASELVATSTLQGATTAFQVVGAGAVTSVGAWLTWLFTRNLSYFSDPASDHFVAEPEIVSIVAGVMCLLVSGAFMAVFDTVSDMLLFTWVLDRKFRKENGLGVNPNIPTKLKGLMADYVGTERS